MIVPNVIASKTIAIIIADLRGGGAERVAVNLANGFVAHGYQVDLVALSAAGQLLSELHPKVRVVNLGVARLRRVLAPLVRYLRSARPAAVLGFMWPLTSLLVVARAISLVKLRLVLSEHCTWSQSELLPRPLMRWRIALSMRLTFPRADAIVCVSRGAADDLAQFASLERSKISVIYNPVVRPRGVTTVATPSEPKDWCVGDHYRIVAVGSLKEIKDHSTLLKAFAALRQSLDVKLLVLGEGHCRPALQAQIEELGIQDSVFMPGFFPDPTPYFAHADLHVLSSTSEGLGNVIIEALAMGTPVVSTDCPHGPREILLDGKYGNLVPVSDASSLCQAMAQSLVTTHDHAALVRRAEQFTVDAAVDQYLQILVARSTTEGAPR